MPAFDFFAPLLAFNLIAATTPGPNNLIVVAVGARFGYRRALPFILGVTVGWPLLLLAVGLGLGAVFERYPQIHSAMRFAGAGFLLWLSWRVATSDSRVRKERRRIIGFLEGAAFQFINPKGWSVALGIISAFTVPGADLAWQVWWIAAINAPIAFFRFALMGDFWNCDFTAFGITPFAPYFQWRNGRTACPFGRLGFYLILKPLNWILISGSRY